ncbi:hypothetical protein FRC11_004229 [Ceratobasidium sp. 423]|nr:hypothetical protein FRC11_004229 [Ceratobasidium sp. 423]
MPKRKANTSAPPSPAPNNRNGRQRKVPRREDSGHISISSDDQPLPTPDASRKGKLVTLINTATLTSFPPVSKADIPSRSKNKKRVESSDEDEQPQKRSNSKPSTSTKGKQTARKRVVSDSDDDHVPVSASEEEPYEPSGPPTPVPPKKGGKRKAQAANQDKEVVQGESSGTSKPATAKKGSKKANRPKGEKKPEDEFGTKKQGLHWMVYGGRTHLDTLADFEEICTMRNHSERAMHNAKAESHREEQRVKELDVRIQELNLQRLELMPKDAIILEFQNQLADKDIVIGELQERLSKMEIQKVETERDLEKEKTGRMKAERDIMTAQERLLRAERAALVAQARSHQIPAPIPPIIHLLMEGALASATSAEKNAFAAAFNTFLQSYRSAIEPNPVDDLPPPVQDPDIPASARVPSEQELKDVGLGEAAGKEVDEELARPGHFQSMAKAAPTVSSSKADSSLKAPAVPVNPNIGTKLAARAKRIFDEDPVAAKANWEEMQERLDQVAYIINPYVSRNRQYMLNAHSLFLGIYRPELSPEAHWHTDVVAQFAGNTLVYRVCDLLIAIQSVDVLPRLPPAVARMEAQFNLARR